jgi:dolichol-phosphate mannosyltransferase
MNSLTLILPAFNEGLSIRDTLKEIDSSVPRGLKVTIFVSEDGSTDNTREEVMAYSRESKNVSVKLSAASGRLGYSRAVLRGIAECKTNLIGFMDADGQCDPKDFKKLVEVLELNKIVVGYRDPRVDSKNRIIYSKLFGVFYRLLGGPKLIDPSSPVIVCNTSEIKALANTTPKLSFGFWWEFQMRVASMNLEVIQVSIKHRVRSAGQTQVYSLKRIPKIVMTHMLGLILLKKEIRRECKLHNNPF